jgi:hypothetical protein
VQSLVHVIQFETLSVPQLPFPFSASLSAWYSQVTPVSHSDKRAWLCWSLDPLTWKHDLWDCGPGATGRDEDSH